MMSLNGAQCRLMSLSFGREWPPVAVSGREWPLESAGAAAVSEIPYGFIAKGAEFR